MQEYVNLLLTILAAVFFGMVIAGVYKMAHSRAVFSRRMQYALLIYAVIPTLILYLNFNIGGIALIGAVTIMRFREPMKDYRDLLYIFWAVASGFACAAHQFILLGTASIFLVVILSLLGAFRNANRVLLIVRGDAEEEEFLIDEIIGMHRGNLKMLYNNSKDGAYTELIYEIKNKCDDKIVWGENFKQKLYDLEGIWEVNLVFQQDDMGI